MAIDIHMYVEVFNADKGRWEKIGKRFKNPTYDALQAMGNLQIVEELEPLIDSPYTERNYDVFAILAGVNNGIGFAGVKTGEGFSPVSSPRGLPEDVSQEVFRLFTIDVEVDSESPVSFRQASQWVEENLSQWVEYGKCITHPDWHDASYLTLKELLDYDWDQFTMKRGLVTLKEFERITQQKCQPDKHSGGVFGDMVKIIEEDEAELYLASGLPLAWHNLDVYVNYHWMVSYRSKAQHFLSHAMSALGSLGTPEKVRIIFWFDS